MATDPWACPGECDLNYASFCTRDDECVVNYNVYAFWFSHLIFGQVHLAHITAHVLLLFRMAEEHSTHCACQCELELLAQLRGRQVTGHAIDLSRTLLCLDHDILDDVPKHPPRRRPVTPPRLSRAQERVTVRARAPHSIAASDLHTRDPLVPMSVLRIIPQRASGATTTHVVARRNTSTPPNPKGSTGGSGHMPRTCVSVSNTAYRTLLA